MTQISDRKKVPWQQDVDSRLGRLEEQIAYLLAQIPLEDKKEFSEKCPAKAKNQESEIERQAAEIHGLQKELDQVQTQARQTESNLRQEMEKTLAKLAQARQEWDTAQKLILKKDQNLEALTRELDAARTDAVKALDCLLPQQDEFSSLQAFVSKISPETRKLAKRYYALDNLRLFLTQSGQFSRLSQFWDACRSKVEKAGCVSGDMGNFLLKILEIYNDSSPESQASAVLVEPKTPYDFGVQHRVGPDGTHIQTVLLPGLKNPAGKVLHKALVILK